MIKRELESVLLEVATQFPVITINGPRQSGKTTLAKSLFQHLPYILLEDVETRMQAQLDPKAFLKPYIETGAIFDEIQHAPELVSYLQGIVDASSKTGRFVLTGSQNFALLNTVAQSLAGRAAVSTLLPLSLSECRYQYDWLDAILKGGYPRLHQAEISPSIFYSSYLNTYIERDVRQLQNIKDLTRFQIFLKLCAGRIGQVINFSSLAQDCGVSSVTANSWLSLLEASYILFRLPPFFKNFNKRLIKMPKLYFYDTGLACHLLGIETTETLNGHYLRGGLFENVVILEAMKTSFNQMRPPSLYFWRDQTGREIDLVIDRADSTHAIEIKSSTTFNASLCDALKYFKKLDPSTVTSLIYNGSNSGEFQATQLIPFGEKMGSVFGNKSTA